MCEKVGKACVCRLALSVGRMARLEEIDLSSNGLDVLPDALFGVNELGSGKEKERSTLKRLILRGNRLTELPASLASSPAASSIEHLDLSHNRLSSFADGFEPWLASLPMLQELVITGNPIAATEGELDVLKKALRGGVKLVVNH
jgi:Leucine-rich repeat (LRR) protein